MQLLLSLDVGGFSTSQSFNTPSQSSFPGLDVWAAALEPSDGNFLWHDETRSYIDLLWNVLSCTQKCSLFYRTTINIKQQFVCAHVGDGGGGGGGVMCVTAGYGLCGAVEGRLLSLTNRLGLLF